MQVGWTAPKGHFYLTGVWVTIHPKPQQNRPKNRLPAADAPSERIPAAVEPAAKQIPAADPPMEQIPGAVKLAQEQVYTASKRQLPRAATATGGPGRKSRAT